MPPVAIVIASTVAAVAVTYTAMKAQMKTPTASDVDRGLDLTRKLDPDYPREVAVGLVASAGSGLYDTVSGPEHKYGWRVSGLSDFEITGFRGLLIAGEEATLSGDPMQGWVDVTSHFLKKDGSPSVRLRVMPGTLTQTLDPQLAAAAGPGSHGGELTASDTFAGVAHAILRFELSQDDELTREPANVVYVYEGAPVHDPRDPASDINDDSTWSRSSDARFNSALIAAQAIRGWYRNGEMIVGAEGVTGGDIPDAKLIVEADICDEPMVTPGGTEPRYRCGGFVRMSQRDGIRPSLAKILASMDGDLVENGGEFVPLAGVERVPSAHYDVQALEGRVLAFDEHGSATDRVNGTIVTIVDPEAAWQAQQLEAYQPAEWLSEDDGRSHWQSIGLDNVYSRHQGERIKLARAKKARPRGSITIELPLIAQQTEPGDWITLTDNVTGQVASVWDVDTVSRVNDPKKGPRIIITAQGIDVTPWTWDQSAADGVRDPGSNTYPDDSVPSAAAPVLTLDAISVEGGGATEPAIKASYAIGESPLSSHVEFQWWQSANTDEIFSATCEKSAGSLVLREGISPDTEYQVRARLTGGPTRNGAWSAPSAVTTSDTYSVPAVGGLTAAQINAGAQAAADAATAANALAVGAQAAADDAAADALESLNEWDALATGLGVPSGEAPEGVVAQFDSLDTADEEALVRINRLEPPAENLIQDAWFKVGGGEFWRIDGRTPADLIPTADAMRVGAEVEASGSGLAVTLSYSVRKPVKSGEVFEISAGVFTSGVATAPALHLVIYDAESGGTVQETLSEAVTANTRDGSFAISPTVDGWAQFEVTANATGAGSLTLDVEAPVWRVADDGQAAISAEPSRDDPSLVFLEEIQRINHRLAASESVWHAESERAFAGISDEALVRLEDDQALAAQQTVLESQISGVSDDLSLNYLSIAGAALLYLTAAEIDSAMTLFDLSLNASHQAVVSDVADLGTNLATNYRTSSEADLVFMTSAQVNSVVTLFDLSLNASHQSVVTDLATLDGEVDALALDLTTNYYTSAEADLTFTTLAEVNAAISTYSVTIGATTLTLEEWVEDHNAELDPAVPGSTANVAVNALAQTDFGSEFDTRWNTAISTYAVSVNSASRTLVAHLDHIEDGVDGIASDLAANYYTQAEANAQFMTGTEVDSAIAAYQLTVNASTRTIFGHLDHIEDLADTTAADLAANYYTEAQADGLFMTSTEVDSAIGAIQFTVNASTRTIASHLNHIEDLADATAADLTANYYTRAEADLEFTTLAEVTSTISTLTLSVNGSTRTIAGHLDHVEDGMDAVTSDLAANYLTTAEANAEFMTATEVDSAIGSYQISVNAATRTIANHLNHIEDGMDAVTSDLAANYYTEAEANSQFMTASEVDSAIGSWTVSVNASTRTLANHLNHIEDLADSTALDLATNYYTEAEADLAFMTAAEVDSAIATYAITIGATTQDIEAWVSQHGTAITTMQGGGAAYALEVGVGNRILGIYGLNDGISRDLVFEIDTFKIWDGTNEVQALIFDAALGRMKLQGIAVQFADIEDLEVDRIHLASGVLPAKKLVAPIYDGLIWNGNNSGDPSTTAHFKTITRSVPKIAVKEGDTIAFEYQYHLSTQFNSFSWFTFKDRIEFTLWFDDGTWSAYIPQVPEIEHNYGAVNNTGGGPGGTSPVPYHSTRRHEVVASGSPFVQSGKTLVEVEAKLIISPDPRTGGTQCVWASVSGWQTKVKTTLKYLEINASLSIFPTQ